jgi:multidrug efflux system membrane fusion protein
VVKSDKTVEVRQVNVAITENNVAQIASGVSPGETVVIDGQDKLQPGSPVETHLQPANPNGSQNAGSANAQNPSSSNPNSSSTNHNPGKRSSQNRHGPPDSGKPSTGTATQ